MTLSTLPLVLRRLLGKDLSCHPLTYYSVQVSSWWCTQWKAGVNPPPQTPTWFHVWRIQHPPRRTIRREVLTAIPVIASVITKQFRCCDAEGGRLMKRFAGKITTRHWQSITSAQGKGGLHETKGAVKNPKSPGA